MATMQTTLNLADPSPRKSIRAAYAQHVLREHLLTKLNAASPHRRYGSLPKAPELPKRGKDAGPYQGRICIIGAGVTGLYLGMMLKYLGITNVDILEGSDRIGGRLYTHPFLKGGGQHSYYDVGAMRVPDLTWMQPTINLIDNLGIPKAKYYYVNGVGQTPPVSYFYDHIPITDDKFDQFISTFVEPFNQDFNAALADWMETDNDNYSMRGFLMTAPTDKGGPNPLWTYDETTKAELYDTSTGLFDQAFTEMVIDYADFQNASGVNWYRIEGGGQRISDAMVDVLARPDWPPNTLTLPIQVQKQVSVKALSINPGGDKIIVSSTTQTEYDMVFNTTAMGPLKQMDLEGLNLEQDILTGIRSLSYDRATKVAIKFNKAWWYNQPTGVYGGISGSDLPIRSVVYPSWNDGVNQPAVLMVSYTWAQDATRMASMVPDYSKTQPTRDDPIVKLCLENLVKLWSGRSDSPTYAQLYDMYLDHHAFAWSNDPWTGGAYALYGPGQYKNVYPQFLPLLCDGKFAICGEAISAHHAWISGSLDSAYIKMEEFLMQNDLTDELERLRESPFGGGTGKHPEEMDEELVKWAVLLSEGGGPKGWGDEFKLKKPQRKNWKTEKETASAV